MANIAIDFDDTYTADPELWDLFVSQARARGHRCFCVTARRDTEENVRICVIPDCPTIFTRLSAKKAFCERLGLKIDIWIDDSPHIILQGF